MSKPSTARFPGTSLFEGTADARAVEGLGIAEPGSRLTAQAQELPGVIGVRLTGLAEIPERAALGGLLQRLHAAALEREASQVELDVRTLRFMASSCFKELLTFLTRVAELPEAQRYRIRFVADPFVRWQRPSLQALHAFAPGVVATEA